MKRFSLAILAISAMGSSLLLGQQQTSYGGSVVTGQLVLSATVNAMQQAQMAQSQAQSQSMAQGGARLSSRPGAPGAQADTGPLFNPRMHARFAAPVVPPRIPIPPMPTGQSLPVENVSGGSADWNPTGVDRARNPGRLTPDSTPVAGTNVFGFLGLTHLDQRDANNGNQFNVEPPSQGLAVGNGYILEGVNNAIQVYDMSGHPLLPVVISTNQLFGLPPAINRSSLAFGPDPTDIRAYYDQSINRFFVVQRLQSNDSSGDPLPESEEIIAVSQTGDPTANYNVYTIDTTSGPSFFCPCVSDYPQIGADQYGFYISANEYNWFNADFAEEANILAISKSALAAGVNAPPAVKFEIGFSSAYEFAIQPTTTPPGASNYLASGGLEYFVSSLRSDVDSNLALWAMVNTSSLNAATPNLTLVRTLIPTESYFAPNFATQKNGPLPYGSTLTPPGILPLLDGGDTRVLSAVYAGGRVYAALSTQLQDDNLNEVVGIAYVVISPAYRGTTLSGAALRQGYILTDGEHLLRPSIAVNSQGNGAMVVTLTGPNYFPSAAFIPFNIPAPTASSPAPFVLGSAIHLAGAGAFPEDGFTGYPDLGFVSVGTARWGDYSAAVINGSDGSIFMGTEYIPNAPRAPLANWGTYVIHYTP